MITLYGVGPNWGLPDPSPFVCKTHVLLKMAGLPYRFAKASFTKAPKGKIPYIEDGGPLMGDSTLIRWYLERNYGVDFDKGLSAAEKATAWAFEKMSEDHLYWTIIEARWNDPRNFEKGPRVFFDDMPAPLRPVIKVMAKRQVKGELKGHGLGRHSKDEIHEMAAKDLRAISDFLGSKPWLMGSEPCGADAAAWSMVAGALCPQFETPVRTMAEQLANLIAYRDRGMARWFPELASVQIAPPA